MSEMEIRKVFVFGSIYLLFPAVVRGETSNLVTPTTFLCFSHLLFIQMLSKKFLHRRIGNCINIYSVSLDIIVGANLRQEKEA